MTDLLTIDWDDDAPVATKPKIQLRGPQPGWVDAIEADLKTHTRLLAVAPGGIGKCLGRGTPVMRFDGRIVHVEDIRVGDLLMGPDSMPRRVASTCYGIDELYRIEPVKGDPYVVTKDHVLSLKLTGNRPIHHMGEKHIGHGKIVNTKVSDLLATTNNFRHCTNGWRTGVDFQPTELHPLIPPYMLGLWLGDGSADSFSISKPDPEVLKSVNDYADSIGHRVRSTKGKCPTHNVISPEDAIRGRGLRPNQATNALRDLGLLSGKHIPHAYKTASRADRLELLAGILDSDGHMCKGCSCYDYITKDIALCEDVAFVARSLGFAAYYKPCRKGCQNGFVGDYFRMSISGDVSELPMRIPRKKSPPRTQKKSVLVTGIEAVPVGEGEYFGFQLDGPDGLFLLGDFTVTHNSTVFAFLAARMWARGIRTLVLENRDRLTRQTAKRLADETGLQVEIEMGDEHASPFAPIVVACVQSLGRTNRLTGFADDHFGMVVADECHLSLANQWQRILNYFHYGAASLEEEWSAPPDGTYQPKASVVGFTASPDIGDRKNLGQFYQKRSVDYTYLEAVEDGWLVGIRQTSIPVKIDLKKYKARSTPTGMDFSTNDLSAAMVPIIEELAEQHAKHARDKKSIAFLPSVECARMMTDALIRRGIKSMFVSGECFDGDEKTEDFVRSGPGTTLCNAMIYTYGVDFPDVDCIGWYRATVSKAFYCLDEQTEVLTRDGWRRDVDVGQLVAAFDKDSGSISYVPALAKIRRPLEAGEHFFSIKSRSCDIRVTSKHRMLYDHKKRTGWKFVDAERLAEIRDTSYLPASGIGVEQAGVPLTDHEISFIGWVMTDGCISKQHKQIAITQASHQPWIGEIEKCIRGCGFKFTRRERWVASQFKRNSTTVIWTISFGRPRSTDKHLTGWGRLDKWLSKELAEPLMRMSPRQFDVFINAVHLGDGSKFKTANYVRHAYHITTGSRTFADRLQALALSCGYKCGVSEIHELGRTKLVVRMKKSPFHRVGGKSGDRPQWVSETACRGEQCWCVENALGTLVVRRNGKAIIVGNCQGIYRGTRVLPGTIDGLSTAEERRAAIARSRKTILTVMDPLFVSDRIDLMELYDLFTDKPEVKRQMKEKGELNPESAREGERDFIKALEKAAKKNAHKAARTIDPVAFALNIGDSALAHYEPKTDREAAPMTVGQREYLQRNRIDISKVTCHGHAQKLIGRHLQRLQLKLATAEQLAFLKQLGFKEEQSATLTMREASAAIDARVKRK